MLNSDFQKLSVAGIVTLYQLDATRLGGGVFYGHGHIGFDDWQIIDGTSRPDGNYQRDIIWQGQVYSPIAIQSDGLELRGDGKASTT